MVIGPVQSYLGRAGVVERSLLGSEAVPALPPATVYASRIS
jgi:hypothetical protein